MLGRTQRGMSVFSVMFMLMLLGFVAIFIIKLIPVYIEYFNVRSVMASFRTDTASYANAVSVQDALTKRFNVNDVKSVSAEDVLVEPGPGGYTLRLDYEVIVPFVSNISLMAKFSEEGQARGGSESP